MQTPESSALPRFEPKTLFFWDSASQWTNVLQNVSYQRTLEDSNNVNMRQVVCSSSYLQLSTKALASSNRESGRSAVRQSVMLKKCFSLPMNVDWSHRGASMSNELRAIVFVKMQVQINALKVSQPVFTLQDVSPQLQTEPEEKAKPQKSEMVQQISWVIVNACKFLVQWLREDQFSQLLNLTLCTRVCL